MGWLTGIEPATSASTERRSNQMSYSHHLLVPTKQESMLGGIRTHDLLLRRQLLYPAELPALLNVKT